MKGVRRLGVRVGNWLTAGEGKKLLGAETATTVATGIDHAIPKRRPGVPAWRAARVNPSGTRRWD